MLIGSIPPTGIPMQFISAGGTRLSVFMGAIGILINIAKNRKNGSFRDFRLKNIEV